MFNYQGYTKEELISLCSEENAYRGKSDWKYWTAEVYSFGKHLRDYGLYPQWLPLYVYTDHGPNPYARKVIPKNELEHNAYCQFYHASSIVEMFKKTSKKPCYTMISPFVFYRRENKIEKLSKAKGTLVFPTHTTPDLEDLSNIENYIAQIKDLPKEYQPVCVCLHMHDIHKGGHEIYLKNNIPVYTVGNAFDFRFAKRFYDLLKNFKYSTSNIIGAYTYYTTEMGIPFFVYGNKPLLINYSDPNFKKGEHKFQEEESYLKVYRMFNGSKTEITNEQKEHVEKALGLYDGISRFKMTQILYTAYFLTGGPKDSIIQWFKYVKKYPLFFLKNDFWKWLLSKDNY